MAQIEKAFKEDMKNHNKTTSNPVEAVVSWISVKDELPENRSEVLFYIAELDQIELGKYNESTRRWMIPHRGTCYTSNNNWVTHWRPLPESPQSN